MVLVRRWLIRAKHILALLQGVYWLTLLVMEFYVARAVSCVREGRVSRDS